MEAISSTTGDEIIISSTMQKLDSPSRASHPFGPVSDGGVKLFGVRLTNTHAGSLMMMMRKTVSMGNLASYNNTSSSPPQAATHPSTSEHSESGEGLGPTDPLGYVSDGLVQNSGSLRERKKGVPWTEEEHRMFLAGLQKLGKGDWRGIARNFVPSRTPTQVASHAQKYFLRQSNLNKRKRRSSLFDMISSSPVSLTVIKADCAGSLVTELNLASPTISAELRLGRPEETHREQQSSPQRWRHQFSSPQQARNIVGTQGPRIPQKLDLCPLTLSFSPPSSFTESNIVRPSSATGSFTSSAAFSSSSSSSSLSSLGRIDESPELLASLALSIGPPLLLEPSAELTLKLEQPTSARHSAIGVSTNSSSRITNAIRVV